MSLRYEYESLCTYFMNSSLEFQITGNDAFHNLKIVLWFIISEFKIMKLILKLLSSSSGKSEEQNLSINLNLTRYTKKNYLWQN